MTLTAGYLTVLATKLKIREIVVKSQFIQFNDIRITSLVIGMATFAGLASNRRHTSMVASMTINILSDLLMTIQAQYALSCSMKPIVTLGTFMIELGVILDQLARADQGLDTRRTTSCRHGQ